MKKSEKILLGLFALLFVVIIGGGLASYAWGQYQSAVEENEALHSRLAEMRRAVAEGAEWQRRSAWLDENVPQFPSRQAASSRLLETIQTEAAKTGLNLAGREFVEPVARTVAETEEAETPGGYFDQAAVKLNLVNVQERTLFTWLHALQRPESFLGVTRFQMNPGGQGKGVNAEIEITQFYRESPQAKTGRSSGGVKP